MEPEIGDLWREYPDVGLAGPQHSIYEVQHIGERIALVLWAGPGQVTRLVSRRRLQDSFVRWRAARYAVLTGETTFWAGAAACSSSNEANS